ncbi:GNAT family N-acetyltransferase [Thalassospira profundimaris]|uniref:GNAT family N-acetyltransferase n=1 Tax=Thalassospira profundimaris TaxID=502049 RepID=UPI0002873A69|nr:GNAT family N-acetyltransferase [Thalassospira profundimaris]EKF06743.1 putative GCN5-related N-acetyltransferase [Thalassospira profundimaris WP0211]
MITIRPFADSDAKALVEIYRHSVTEIGPNAYNPEQVAVWAKLLPTPERFIEIMTDGRFSLVAVDNNDQVVAFGDVEADGHIGFLYALPDFAGKGIVTKLYDALEAHARKQDIGKLYSEASEFAKSFLLKQGFSVVERRDFEVAGVPIHNYAVEKRLRAPR